MSSINHKPDYTDHFGDKRLSDRAKLLSQSLFLSRSSSIHGSTSNQSEQKGFYRFLSNDKVTEDALIDELCGRCGKNAVGRDVIVIQDSSSIGLSEHSNHIKAGTGLGFVGNKTGLGFLTHASLVLDADNETMLGFCDVQLWHREEDKSNNTTKAYKKQPIEAKESYKWIKASQQAKKVLAHARSITIIEDREGDIYEQFAVIPDKQTQVIIRNRDNRKLKDGSKLHDCLLSAPVLGFYEIEVCGDARKNKVSRTAKVEVKAVEVTIQKPVRGISANIVGDLKLYAIEVKEKGSTAKTPLCWRLLTTEKIKTYEEAVKIINRYKQRWHIEQLFRLLKKQGYQIESSQLESGWSIRKLFVLLLNATIRVMQLYMAYGEEESQAVTEVFSDDEIKCLEVIEQNHIAKTEKTSNPFFKKKLAWASWIIARLGGWKGNNKQRNAGPILLRNGLAKFESIFLGWKLSQNLQ